MKGVDLGQGPLVSVVIPAYNAASRIRETLDSVYAQSYQNFEIVLVNDGSPDTVQLEQAIQGYDQRLIYLKQENQGPSGARNTAIRAARGKYVACLDSDDIYLPGHLERLLAKVESSGLDLAYSDVRARKLGVRKFEHEPQDLPVTFEKILTEACTICTSATMSSRQAMVDAGLFDEHYRRCEDFDLWLRMSFRGAKIDIVPEVGIEHRAQPDGLSADPHLLSIARIEVYKKTLNTLPLSQEQKRLVQKLVTLTAQRTEMELMRKHLLQKQYAEAKVAARNVVRQPENMRSFVLACGAQIAPSVVGRYMDIRRKQAKKRARNALLPKN